MSTLPDWEISDETAAAQMQAVLDLLNTGPDRARIAIYATSKPATIKTAHTSPVMATIELAIPAGEVISGVLVLYAKDTDGALVMFQGIPRWADLIAGNGVIAARTTATDVDHDGGVTVLGGETPAGDNSPLLYAGSKVQLGAVALT